MACSQDEDCSGSSSCEVFQRPGESDPVQACLLDDEAAEVACESHNSCAQLLGNGAYCGIHGFCVRPSEGSNNQGDGDMDGDGDGDGDSDGAGDGDALGSVFYLVIEQLDEEGMVFEPNPGDGDDGDDGSLDPDDGDGDGPLNPGDEDEGDDPGDSGDDETEFGEAPPVRLGAVVLRNSSNAAVGYGDLGYLAGHPDAAGSLMTEALSLTDDGTCTDPDPLYEAPILSLGGPGGLARVLFYERPSLLLSPQSNWRIQILAESEECLLDEEPPSSSRGEYRVFFCVSPDGHFDQERDCYQEFPGPLSGYSDLEVTFGY